MKIKICFLFFILLFVSGCTVDYTVSIDQNKKVDEVIRLTVPTNGLSKNEIKELDTLLNEKIEANFSSNDEEYEATIAKKNNGRILNLKVSHTDLNVFSTSHTLLKSMFEDIVIVEDFNRTTVQIPGEYVGENLFSESEHGTPYGHIEAYEIKFKLQNKIIDHNADHYDENNNVLTWKIDSETVSKDIRFQFNDEVRYDILIKDFILENMAIVIFISSLLVIGLISAVYFVIIYKKNNAI